MNFRIRHKLAGKHVHMRVFIGQQKDHTHGNAGELCMEVAEFDMFRRVMDLGQVLEVDPCTVEFVVEASDDD